MNGQPLVIVLIEDNEDHAELIMRCFEDHSILNTIHHISDGEAAIQYLLGENQYCDRKKYPLPNLILLDLRLPKVDGLEVLARIKEDEAVKHIPVVVLTSSANDKDLVRAYEYYVNSYLVKPLDFDKFTKMMNELGFYWLGWNKTPI